MVAAVLHLHEGAGAAGESVDQVRGALLDRHDVADDRLRRTRLIDARRAPRPTTRRLSFSALPRTRSASRHGGERLRLGLRRAAGDDDVCLRALAAQRADRLARLAHRLRGHRAGIDHHRVGEPGLLARWRRITSDSAVLSRQPKVTTSMLITPPPRRQTEPRRSGPCARTRPGRSSARGRRPRAIRWRDRRPARSLSPCGSVRRSRAAATAAAQAAEPQALVRPAPRSQVRITRWSREGMAASVMLARCGKHRMVFEQRADFFADRRRSDRRPRKSRADCPC